MGILDWFRRRPDPRADDLVDLYARSGAHGADLETLKGRIEALRDEWLVMRDEIRKLVQRLEKRDLRAEQRAAADAEEAEAEAQDLGKSNGPRGYDEIEAQRALRDRKWRGR